MKAPPHLLLALASALIFSGLAHADTADYKGDALGITTTKTR